MIDTSAYALWASNELDFGQGYVIGDPQADSPRARRLQVLIAEARAAGTPWAAIAQIFVDWIGVVLPQLQRGDAFGVLKHERARAEALILGEAPAAPRKISVSKGKRAADSATRRLAATLHGVVGAFPDSDGDNPCPADAWTWAVDLLAAIADVGGEPAIAKCAELAYRRLFCDVAEQRRMLPSRARGVKRKRSPVAA